MRSTPKTAGPSALPIWRRALLAAPAVGGEAGRQAVHGDGGDGGRGQGDAYAEYADDRGGGGDTGGRVEGRDEEGADAACDEAGDQDEAGGGADHEASDQRAEEDGEAVEGDEADGDVEGGVVVHEAEVLAQGEDESCSRSGSTHRGRSSWPGG
ncbi:hypothetical protein ACQSMD_08980 [Streptomyces flavovirens]|uniref:hypothetical protein n=1 Tax=Streptomyces flavovirens TaxID=52258 RepID=UPI003D0C730A